MQGFALKSSCYAASKEPFDFLLHYCNCSVCRYNGATTVELQKVHLYSRAARRLQPGQVLGPSSALRGRTSAAGAGARSGPRTRRRGELALACVVLSSQHRQQDPSASAGPAPTHIPPAAGLITPLPSCQC